MIKSPKTLIMDTRQAYDMWASQYDTNDNKTRDLEAQALRKSLENIALGKCLEIGCGTGKNTEWLIKKSNKLTAVDLSEEMIAKAKEKIGPGRVQFKQADITKDWNFTDGLYDLVCFSLVLEHIENLDHIFKRASASLNSGGFVYIGELHPFKQYSGSKARFDSADGLQVLECFNHNISDFIQSARKYGLLLWDLEEYFDDNDRSVIPRILAILLRKT
jgi:2-polyprenyl-3-methyl-5-hydroxy-6-metoxy-1,4-benzoquinol methylase